MKADSTERVERLLALIMLQNMKGANAYEKVLQLSLAGFTTAEIANILETSSILVSKTLYAAKKQSNKQPRK
jgi:DNA-directed RNA polymerase specialized sigma24 family protein